MFTTQKQSVSKKIFLQKQYKISKGHSWLPHNRKYSEMIVDV